jgi:predicted nucleic acid-binding protein
MKAQKRATYVMDNSVLIKPLLREDGAEKVEKILLRKERFELSLLVPDIFRYEFFNILTRGFNAEIAMAAWLELTERQVSIIPLEVDLIDMANRLVTKYAKISFYDAAYHALALAYCVDYVTADEKYYNIVKKEGNIRLLEDFKI